MNNKHRKPFFLYIPEGLQTLGSPSPGAFLQSSPVRKKPDTLHPLGSRYRYRFYPSHIYYITTAMFPPRTCFFFKSRAPP